MKYLSTLIKPASSECNLRCRYCFYANVSSLRKTRSFGIMKQSTMEKMLDNIFLDLEDGDHMTFAFQGGEPTLAGLPYFKAFVAYVKTKNRNVRVQYSLQTNGTLIDNNWCVFLKENNFLAGISVDGGAKFHNDNRIDANEKGTYSRVMNAKRLFDKYGIDYNILYVLTNQNARHPQKIFNFILKENIRYVQFIPCLDVLESKGNQQYALRPQLFARFYKSIFTLWKNELESGNYISISLFDNIVNLLATGRANSCGMLGECQPQYVIESNGNVYPCDFYVLDEYCLGNITVNRLYDMFKSSIMNRFIVNESKTPSYCAGCPFFKMCHGGCKRMKSVIYSDGNYCGYQDFLNDCLPSLMSLIEKG